ncbi:MAG: TolC family protein [Phycisphaerales bacterium]
MQNSLMSERGYLRAQARRRGPRPAPPRASLLFASLVLVAGAGVGCQSYERRPLDLAATREAWLARSPSDETARQFADRLAQAEGRGDAAAFDPGDGLTLAEGEPVALVFNRGLRLARLEANVTRATADHAGRWDDPVLGVDIERIVSDVPDPWVVAGTVGLTIPISGRLAVEKARAGAEYAVELQRVAVQEWATRAALRELWVQWSAETTRLALATELVERLRAVSALAERQEQAGVMSKIDARLFRVELAGSEADVITARARAKELELQLRDILGLAPDAPVRLVETVAFEPRGTDPAWLQSMMESSNPELLAVRGEYDVAEESLRLEVRKQYPDLTIGPGYGTDQGDDRVLLGLRLPLPLWNRNQQGVAQATANREVARGRYENTFEHLASKLTIARTRFDAGRAVREAVESRVLPLADEQDADVRRVAELGRVDPLLLLQAIKSQYDAKVRLVDARAAEAIGGIRLDELIGPPAPPPSSETPESSPADPQTPTPGGRP